MRKKSIVIILFTSASLITGTFFVILIGNLLNTSVPPEVMFEHSPIYINGNSELDDFCNGSDGLSWATAHVIKNFIIDANDTGSGIEILNTDRYLIIKNCHVNNSGDFSYTSTYDSGIELHNCTNVKITNCLSYDNYYGISLSDNSHDNEISFSNLNYNNHYGIYLENSNDNFITGNNISFHDGVSDCGIFLRSSDSNKITHNNVTFNDRGMEIWMSDGTVIENNNASYSRDHGIRVRTSNNCEINDNIAGKNGEYGIFLYDDSYITTLRNNIMINDGLMVDESFNNDIDTSNLVNGKPIYYYDSLNGATINGVENAGQVIISNCQNSVISNWNISDISDGIVLSGSDDNTLSNCNARDNYYHGILVLRSDRNNITNNYLTNNGVPWDGINYNVGGIYLDHSSDNSVNHNVFIHNNRGIDLYYAFYNNISDNYFKYNLRGVYMFHGDNSDVFNNTMDYNRNGVHLIGTIQHEILNNTITHSDYGIYISGASDNIISSNNLLLNDNGSNNCGIYMRYSDRNIISDNNILYNDRWGMYIQDSDNNTILNNDISHAAGEDGIFFWTSHGNDVINNTISHNDYSGLYFYDSNDNTIIGNNITENGVVGIYGDYADNNDFICNNISYNTFGIYFFSSSNNNTIWSNNTVSDNTNTDVMGTPTINEPVDYAYIVGTTSHNITWNPNQWNTSPNYYIILRNGALIANNTWSGGNIVEYIDGLSVGTYKYTCTAYATNGNRARDTVVITVKST